MAKNLSTMFDRNREAFQMRAQWKKMDICRKQWSDRWSWLLDERKRALEECKKLREEVASTFPAQAGKLETSRSLKPVPVTSTGFIGWLATKPECQLEIYTSWLTHVPLKLPDIWDDKNYVGSEKM